MQAELKEVRAEVKKLTDVLTKMSGVKLAFTILGIVAATIATQLWNFINWRGN